MMNLLRRGNVPQSFSKEFACYPVIFAHKEHIENGNKILLPESSFKLLANMDVTWPMLFEVANPDNTKSTHCGVLEFTAPEGQCYVPQWIMDQLELSPGHIVRVRNTSLPKGTYVKLRPCSVEFLDISNPRAVLETSLRRFAALTVGDKFKIDYDVSGKTFSVEIIECRPNRAISIIETDVQVDFALPEDYIEPKPLPDSGSTENDKEPWKKQLPKGVRKSNAKYDELIRNGKIPGMIGKTSNNSAFEDSARFKIFTGKGRNMEN